MPPAPRPNGPQAQRPSPAQGGRSWPAKPCPTRRCPTEPRWRPAMANAAPPGPSRKPQALLARWPPPCCLLPSRCSPGRRGSCLQEHRLQLATLEARRRRARVGQAVRLRRAGAALVGGAQGLAAVGRARVVEGRVGALHVLLLFGRLWHTPGWAPRGTHKTLMGAAGRRPSSAAAFPRATSPPASPPGGLRAARQLALAGAHRLCRYKAAAATPVPKLPVYNTYRITNHGTAHHKVQTVRTENDDYTTSAAKWTASAQEWLHQVREPTDSAPVRRNKLQDGAQCLGRHRVWCTIRSAQPP